MAASVTFDIEYGPNVQRLMALVEHVGELAEMVPDWEMGKQDVVDRINDELQSMIHEGRIR